MLIKLKSQGKDRKRVLRGWLSDIMFINRFGVDVSNENDEYASQHATASGSPSPMREKLSSGEEEERIESDEQKLSRIKSEIIENINKIYEELDFEAKSSSGIVVKRFFKQLVQEHLEIKNFNLDSPTEQTSNYTTILQNVANTIGATTSLQDLSNESLAKLINNQYTENAGKTPDKGIQKS